MTNKGNAAIRSKKIWLTISLIVIAITLITISLFSGGMGGLGLSEALYFVGIIILFIALLNTWNKLKRKYYVILMGVSVLLIFLLFKFGIGALVNIQSQYQIQGHWAEDMAWSVGGIFFAGFMAGLVGIFVCIARWR